MNIFNTVWIIVTTPWQLLKEITNCARAERVILITDHPNGQRVADQLQFETGLVPATFASIDTAIVHLRTTHDISLNMSGPMDGQMADFPMESQLAYGILSPADLVIIDWGYSGYDDNMVSLNHALRETGYNGCVLTRDWQDGQFKCQKCGDDCASGYLEKLNATLPLEKPSLGKRHPPLPVIYPEVTDGMFGPFHPNVQGYKTTRDLDTDERDENDLPVL